jgi:hypothetical protein
VQGFNFKTIRSCRRQQDKFRRFFKLGGGGALRPGRVNSGLRLFSSIRYTQMALWFEGSKPGMKSRAKNS